VLISQFWCILSSGWGGLGWSVGLWRMVDIRARSAFTRTLPLPKNSTSSSGGRTVSKRCKFSFSLNDLPSPARWFFVALIAMLALPLISTAQDTGYISGTVTDKSGAAVVGAEVTVKNVTGSVTRATTTNADGAYAVAGLAGDTYNLVVIAKGFQKFTAE